MYQSLRSYVDELYFDAISGSIKTNFCNLSPCYEPSNIILWYCSFLFVIILTKSCARSYVFEFSFDVISGSIKTNWLV